MTATHEGLERPKRLDERVEPGWARMSENLLKYGGVVVGAVVLWLGFLTGGFFLLLTGVLAAIAAIGGWLLGSYVARESWYARPDAKPYTLIMVVAFPIALIAFAQFAGPLLTPPPTTSATFSGSLSSGQEKIDVLAVDPRIDTMSFTIDVTVLDNGALRWYVADPTGQSRWSGRTAETGSHQTTLSEAILPGQWTIHVVSEATRADYRLDWAGSTSTPN